jgi:hypothetical protein
MLDFLLSKLSYNKEEKIQYLSKRLGGVWLIWIGFILIVSIKLGGEKLVHQTLFGFGYGLGLYLLFGVKPIRDLFSFGPPSVFQRNVTNLSIALMFLLMFFIGGPFYATMNYRMIWLGALMAVAIHFLPFYFVHGTSMLALSFVLIIVVGIGYISPNIPFSTIGYLDAFIKILFGIVLVLSKKP